MVLPRSGATMHAIMPAGSGHFWLMWAMDQKYGRYRYPRTFMRYADRAGALRYAKKWSIQWRKGW